MTATVNFETFRPESITENFTIIVNEAFTSYSLSANEQTLLLRVFMLPSKIWTFTIRGMATTLKWGEKRVRNTIRSLIRKGFAYREERGRAPKGARSDEGAIGGNFVPDYYAFYALPSLNPHFTESQVEDTEKNFGKNKKHEKTGISMGGHYGRSSWSDHVDLQVNTETRTELYSQSVSPEETTDGLQTESEELNYSLENDEQFTFLETLMKEHSNYDSMKPELKDFVLNAIKYLKEAVISGSIELSDVTDKLEEIISKEGSLFVFLKKISYKCKKALKKLKRPSAKDNFLISTICNQLQEYKPKTQEIQNQPEQAPEKRIQEHQGGSMPSQSEPMKKECPHPLSFKDMLSQIGSPLLNDHFRYGDEPFENEEAFKEFYGEFDLEEWAVQRCSIPESFKDRPEDMENALKFLTGWSSLPSDDLLDSEYKAFVGRTIHFLAKAIHTNESISAWNIISKLNYINMDIDNREEALYKFMKSFYKHFQKNIMLYPARSNEEKYITTMLINYLMHDYQAKDMIGIGKMMGYIESFKKK